MCVLYRGLNKVTIPFKYPIPQCDDAIPIIEVGASVVYRITVDEKQGYRQVTVYKVHRGELAFFLPITKKYTIKVMPFGSMNAPRFYTCMMGELRIEWHALFLETLIKRKFIGSMTFRVTDADEIHLNGINFFQEAKE